jgi:hypothetical protein
MTGANDFMKKMTHKTGGAAAVACSELLGNPSPSQFLKAYLNTLTYNGIRITGTIRLDGSNDFPERIGSRRRLKSKSHSGKIKAYGFQNLAERNLLSQIWRCSATNAGKLIAASNIVSRPNLPTIVKAVTVTRSNVSGHA